ncbi:hypothetical protein ACFTXM_33720 [Streptomyces sp. NPDC056930]|uniref:glycosyl hydrolase family 95 catalytic domain-containing protein n=1 Tax=Streptomyces sp. NPDC056930 TaxID=3345967 RepID=UPI00363D577C
MDSAVRTSYKKVRDTHVRDHRALFDRVALDIGQQLPDLPTDQLLARYTEGTSPADRALDALFFQYGRYLLIASSRAGSLPADLPGLWNNSTSPPWSARSAPPSRRAGRTGRCAGFAPGASSPSTSNGLRGRPAVW